MKAKAKQLGKQSSISKAFSSATLGKKISAFSVAKAKKEAEKNQVEDGMATLVGISSKDPDRWLSGDTVSTMSGFSVSSSSGRKETSKRNEQNDREIKQEEDEVDGLVFGGTRAETLPRNGKVNNACCPALKRTQSDRMTKKNETLSKPATLTSYVSRRGSFRNSMQNPMTMDGLDANYDHEFHASGQADPDEITLNSSIDTDDDAPTSRKITRAENGTLPVQETAELALSSPPKKRKRRTSQKTPKTSTDSGFDMQIETPDKSTDKINDAEESVVFEEGAPISTLGNSSAIWTMWDSTDAADTVLQWLFGKDITVEKFFRTVWEKRPIHISREQPEYYKGIFGTEELDNVLKTNDIVYGRNLDITRYVDEKRETLNPEGRAYSATVWKFYHEEGCSVRMLNPQSYTEMVWKLCSHLQESFGSFVGSNVYLTPPETQGFAPHWDDIDAFMLQLEGRKHWKVYTPRSDEETLPRESSSNFSSADLPDPPVLEFDMKPGDLLYMPRGYIHQGATDSEHSMHITLSVCQKNTWGDLLAKILPAALEKAIEESVELRRSLPRNYLSTMGIINQPGPDEPDDKRRKRFQKRLSEMMEQVSESVMEMADAGTDQMAKDFVYSALPPVLTQNEQACSINGEEIVLSVDRKKTSQIKGFLNLNADTRVKLLRRHVLRMCVESEEEGVTVYHSAENSRTFQEKDIQSFDLSSELAGGLEHLFRVYPEYTRIEDIEDIETTADKLELANELYKKGLLITEEPLNA